MSIVLIIIFTLSFQSEANSKALLKLLRCFLFLFLFFLVSFHLFLNSLKFYRLSGYLEIIALYGEIHTNSSSPTHSIVFIRKQATM